MGNSTTTLQSVYDYAKAKGIPIPTDQPGGYGTRLALKIGNDVMSSIVAERFNPKWNRAIAPSFLTNSYQQDYPQIGLGDIGWLEEADSVDINNTAFPKPTNIPGITVVRQLSRTSLALFPVNKLCWMYNKDLSYGAWPGNGVAFNPLITSGPVLQNPIMSMVDANGNRLIVALPGNQGGTTVSATPQSLSPTYASASPNGLGRLITLYVLGNAVPAWIVPGQYFNVNVSDGTLNGRMLVTGTGVPFVIGGQTYWGVVVQQLGDFDSVSQEPITGTASLYNGAPLLPANSVEGTTVLDGTVVWTVVNGEGQGFRVFPLPGATGPVYEITAYYQMLLEKLTSLQSLINPIPDDQNYIYQTGVEWMCRMSSPNPVDRAEAAKNWPLWLASLVKLLKQNDREIDAYDALPATSPVESVYGPYRGLRNPQDPSQPY